MSTGKKVGRSLGLFLLVLGVLVLIFALLAVLLGYLPKPDLTEPALTMPTWILLVLGVFLLVLGAAWIWVTRVRVLD